MTVAEEMTVLISALEHYVYCPRQCALIHVEGIFTENVFTLQGRAIHEHADESLTTWEGTT
ncbi:MAG TPA: Dna2/Cas4 domain-containing protein, partial [Armatimonadota bacterium]|nr:Dna2/Cas4 domain-containing protein [Armatimonadota bacterium]